MAFRTRGGHQVDGMAILAGGAAMVFAVPVAAPGVTQVKNGRTPGACVMALTACHASEQARVEGRVGVTGRAGCGERLKYIVDVTAGTG
jgi:hypothetical protein